MLRATTACTFSTAARHRESGGPKVARTCGNFSIFSQKVLRATTACTFSTSQLPKVLREWCVLALFTSNVLRTTTAYTFSTSQLPKAVRTPRVLTLLPSKRASRHNNVALFQHLNFQKWSETEAELFCTLLTSKCASRHSGVHFFDVATSKSAPTLRFFCTV